MSNQLGKWLGISFALIAWFGGTWNAYGEYIKKRDDPENFYRILGFELLSKRPTAGKLRAAFMVKKREINEIHLDDELTLEQLKEKFENIKETLLKMTNRKIYDKLGVTVKDCPRCTGYNENLIFGGPLYALLVSFSTVVSVMVFFANTCRSSWVFWINLLWILSWLGFEAMVFIEFPMSEDLGKIIRDYFGFSFFLEHLILYTRFIVFAGTGFIWMLVYGFESKEESRNLRELLQEIDERVRPESQPDESQPDESQPNSHEKAD